jgi:DNA glycosylase AlkZ-like
MDDAKLRAWWFHRQGLDGSLATKSPAAVLECAGWARSVAGSGPYLTFFARAGISRESVDAAVADLAIHELPSARACTYVVPSSDFALALRVALEFSGGELVLARKLGVTDAEIGKLCDAVLDALRKGPLSPDEIREATGEASRSLGPEGAKKGLTTTLPVALGKLQVEAKIRRVPTNGRLDQQRYRYTIWKPSPLEKFKLSAEESFAELARRYFRWIGPATVAEFQWFSGLGVKAAKAAVERLQLVPAEPGSDRLMFPEDREQFAKFKPPTKPIYALVSCMDSMFLLRRSLTELMTAPAAKAKVYGDKGIVELSGLSDLYSNAILDRGAIIGLWEYDPEAASIVWTTFVTSDKALVDTVGRTEAYIRDQLGDARSFSLDSPKSRIPRIEALRKAQRRK